MWFTYLCSNFISHQSDCYWKNFGTHGLKIITTPLELDTFLKKFVSRSVVTGFVNALAILIFLAQLPELDPSKIPAVTFLLVILGLAIIYTLGHICIAMTVVSILTGASLFEAGLVALIEPSINGVWFYVLHKTWKHFNAWVWL